MKRFFISLSLFPLLYFVLVPAAHAQARISDLSGVMSQLISSFLGIAGVLFVIMVVYSGFTYLSAGANKDVAARALSTLTYAVIGLILSVSAWIIIRVIGGFLGLSNVGVFNICIVGAC